MEKRESIANNFVRFEEIFNELKKNPRSKSCDEQQRLYQQAIDCYPQTQFGSVADKVKLIDCHISLVALLCQKEHSNLELWLSDGKKVAACLSTYLSISEHLTLPVQKRRNHYRYDLRYEIKELLRVFTLGCKNAEAILQSQGLMTTEQLDQLEDNDVYKYTMLNNLLTALISLLGKTRIYAYLHLSSLYCKMNNSRRALISYHAAIMLFDNMPHQDNIDDALEVISHLSDCKPLVAMPWMTKDSRLRFQFSLQSIIRLVQSIPFKQQSLQLLESQKTLQFHLDKVSKDLVTDVSAFTQFRSAFSKAHQQQAVKAYNDALERYPSLMTVDLNIDSVKRIDCCLSLTHLYFEKNNWQLMAAYLNQAYVFMKPFNQHQSTYELLKMQDMVGVRRVINMILSKRAVSYSENKKILAVKEIILANFYLSTLYIVSKEPTLARDSLRKACSVYSRNVQPSNLLHHFNKTPIKSIPQLNHMKSFLEQSLKVMDFAFEQFKHSSVSILFLRGIQGHFKQKLKAVRIDLSAVNSISSKRDTTTHSESRPSAKNNDFVTDFGKTLAKLLTTKPWKKDQNIEMQPLTVNSTGYRSIV